MGVADSTVKPMAEQSMVIAPAVSARPVLTQKVYPDCSKVVSSLVGSSRASARRGPLQPPLARYTLIGVLSLPLKYASSSLQADSVTVIITISVGVGLTVMRVPRALGCPIHMDRCVNNDALPSCGITAAPEGLKQANQVGMNTAAQHGHACRQCARHKNAGTVLCKKPLLCANSLLCYDASHT